MAYRAICCSWNFGSTTVKVFSLISIFALLALASTGHTESVYKLKDESGATVYSDRPDLKGTTNTGTVELAPGPSVEEQQAAKQKARQMETKAEQMRQSRMDEERQRKAEQDKGSSVVEETEAVGVGTADDRRLRDPKTRIPVESRDGEEHPIYEPGKAPPVHITPIPRPRPSR